MSRHALRRRYGHASKKRKSFTAEGVRYHAYEVHFKVESGKPRKAVVYTPGSPWLREAFVRWLDEKMPNLPHGANITILGYTQVSS
jgi:hypothetical protein